MNRATNVTLVQALAGEAPGRKRFRYHRRATDPIACANPMHPEAAGARVAQVDEVTLDDLCARLEIVPRVIKIDVEGAEFVVLRGSVSILRNVRPLVACAVHPDVLERGGTDSSRLVRWMATLGYRCVGFHGNEISRPAFENVLFLPSPSGVDA